jgi:hypothetical protein
MSASTTWRDAASLNIYVTPQHEAHCGLHALAALLNAPLKPPHEVQEYLTHTWPEGAESEAHSEAHYNQHGNYSLVALQRILFWHWSLTEYPPQQPLELQVMSGHEPLSPGHSKDAILAMAPHHTTLLIHTTHNPLTGSPSCPHYYVLRQATNSDDQAWYLVDSLHQSQHPAQVKLMADEDWANISGTIITINECTAQKMIEACEFPNDEPPSGLPHSPLPLPPQYALQV